jgi:hypothetical protein
MLDFNDLNVCVKTKITSKYTIEEDFNINNTLYYKSLYEKNDLSNFKATKLDFLEKKSNKTKINKKTKN